MKYRIAVLFEDGSRQFLRARAVDLDDVCTEALGLAEELGYARDPRINPRERFVEILDEQGKLQIAIGINHAE